MNKASEFLFFLFYSQLERFREKIMNKASEFFFYFTRSWKNLEKKL